MIPEFENLDGGEVELMLKAPFLICILIAGADGNIDNKEIRSGIHVITESARGVQSMFNYYREVEQDFEDKLKILIQSYPFESEKRNPVLTEELAGLNAVLPKLERAFAVQCYKSFTSLARRIAESSGGLLGIKSVGEEESELLSLEMIKSPELG